MTLLEKLFPTWASRRRWRRTVCPHGYFYVRPIVCPYCPHPNYGYGRRIPEPE